MRTEVVPTDPENGPWPELERLAGIVRDGGLVAFPTETVYGIAVNARDESALRRLIQAKGRDAKKPLTIHLSSPSDLIGQVPDLAPSAKRLAARFWPGPLTLVVPDKHRRPTGYRVPSLPLAREFLRLANVTVAATSANASGEPPATDAAGVIATFDGLIDAVIDGGPCRHATASTVVRVVDDRVETLREGAIPAEEISEAAARLILFVCSGNRCRSPFASMLGARMLAKRLGTQEQGLLAHGYRVESAGTACLKGEGATKEAEAVSQDYGLDLTGHRSRPLTPSLVEGADQVFVMTTAQRESILAFAPEVRSRIKLIDKTGKDIVDPYGRGADAYAVMARHVHKALQGRLDDL